MISEPSSSEPLPAPGHGSLRSRAGPGRSRRRGAVAATCLGALLWLITGVVAGVVAAWLMGAYLDYFPIPPLSEDSAKRLAADPFASVPEDILPEIIAAQRAALLRNTALGFGICGALILTVFGLLYGLMLRSWLAIARGLLGGAVIGAVTGALGGAFAVTVQSWLQDYAVRDPLIWLSVSLAAIWVILGAGCGILSAFVGWNGGVGSRAALAAISAGLVAAILYQPVAMILLPMEQLDRVIPASFANRALCVSLATGLVALALGRTLMSRQRMANDFPSANVAPTDR